MSNSFNISFAPELAALDAKIDIIDTEVDAVRAVDVPAIQTNIDANETKIDTIDTVVDAVKLKTDLLPQSFRGSPVTGFFQTGNNFLTDAVNIAGSGKLLYFAVEISNPGDTLEAQFTIDGISSILLSHTGDLIWQRCVFADLYSSAAQFEVILFPAASADSNLLNIEFHTSLRIQIRLSAGFAGVTDCHWLYTLDP